MDVNLLNLIIAVARALEIPQDILIAYFADRKANQVYFDELVEKLHNKNTQQPYPC